MRPTCPYADKNLSTETNLQRSRRPASEQDFLRTTNIKCFSCDKVVSQSQRSLEYVLASHFILQCELYCRSRVPVFWKAAQIILTMIIQIILSGGRDVSFAVVVSKLTPEVLVCRKENESLRITSCTHVQKVEIESQNQSNFALILHFILHKGAGN